MVAGVEDAVVVANQFLFGVLTDGAELFVHIGDGALDIGDGHNSMLIESKLLIG